MTAEASGRRLPPWRRRQIVRSLESIDARICKIREALEGTADAGNSEDADDWLQQASMDIGDAVTRLGGEE